MNIVELSGSKLLRRPRLSRQKDVFFFKHRKAMFHQTPDSSWFQNTIQTGKNKDNKASVSTQTSPAQPV